MLIKFSANLIISVEKGASAVIPLQSLQDWQREETRRLCPHVNVWAVNLIKTRAKQPCLAYDISLGALIELVAVLSLFLCFSANMYVYLCVCVCVYLSRRESHNGSVCPPCNIYYGPANQFCFLS